MNDDSEEKEVFKLVVGVIFVVLCIAALVAYGHAKGGWQ